MKKSFSRPPTAPRGSCTSRQSGAAAGSRCQVRRAVVADRTIALPVRQIVMHDCWDSVARLRELCTRVCGSPSTAEGSACQFPRSWSIRVFMQVRNLLAGALSSLTNRSCSCFVLCRNPVAPTRPSAHRTRPVVIAAALKGGTNGAQPHAAPSSARSRHGTRRACRLSGDGPPRTQDPAAFRRGRSVPRRNGCAPGSGGAAGSRGRRRPLVPRTPTTTRDKGVPWCLDDRSPCDLGHL